MRTAIALLMLSLSMSAIAESPYLVDERTGKYLGNLNNNRYDPNSVSNPYGRYGSQFSPDSINNRFGRYGSQFSPDSPSNPYSTNPPTIWHGR